MAAVRSMAVRGRVDCRPSLSGKQQTKPAPRMTVRASARGSSSTVRFLKDAAEKVGQAATAASLAALLTMAPAVTPAMANEIDILFEPVPERGYIIDDARVLNRTTAGDVNKVLAELEKRTGYRVNVVTVRKLEFTTDAFEFADKVLEKWYPTAEIGDKKSVLLLVTTSKEGALTGGPSFSDAIGDDLIESVSTENIPILGVEEKYNEAIFSSVKRIIAKLDGQTDPGPPAKADSKRVSNYKKKEETENKRGQFSTVVIGLLVISFVVPMVQYYSYVAKPKE